MICISEVWTSDQCATRILQFPADQMSAAGRWSWPRNTDKWKSHWISGVLFSVCTVGARFGFCPLPVNVVRLLISQHPRVRYRRIVICSTSPEVYRKIPLHMITSLCLIPEIKAFLGHPIIIRHIYWHWNLLQWRMWSKILNSSNERSWNNFCTERHTFCTRFHSWAT
jgi:hypothetical protein